MERKLSLWLGALGLLAAGGYKIPEQSLEGMALGAAHIAHTTGADSAYYNPANMAFLDPETRYAEADLSLVHLPKMDYKGLQFLAGHGLVPADGTSEKEWAVFPTLHYVHRAQGRARWGVSLTAPVGQTRRWNSPIQKTFAERFYLMTAELNPSLSVKVTDTLALAAGIRFIYSEGKVDSDGRAAGIPLRRQMWGDTTATGYNLALAWHPVPDWEVGVTYRSRVDLTEEGTANLYLGGAGQAYSARVTIPMPAALNIGVAKTFDERLTVELVYERTYWSAYQKLDFEYDTPIPPALVPYFDDPKNKQWRDTNTFRIGVTYKWDDRLTLMGGYAYDQTPVPSHSLSYELPDSDANIFTAGFTWQQTKRLKWGAAILYDHKKRRRISASDLNEYGIVGGFDKGGAILATVGFEYKF